MTAPSPVIDPRAQSALRRLEWQLRRRSVQTLLGGAHRSVFRGRGMEFDQVVRYAYGDDIRDIDWNVTARLGDLYRKVFVEERELTIFAVVSDDPALQFGSGAVSKREILLQLAALVMLLAVVNREAAGLLHVTPTSRILHSPTRRRARLLSTLAELFAAEAPDPAPPSPFQSMPLLSDPVPQGALVVWFGEIPPTPPPPEWAAFLRRHPVVGVRVEDPWERALPEGDGFTAFDPAAGRLTWVETGSADRAAHAAWRAAREDVWRAWWPNPLDRLVVDTGADPLSALVGFLRARRAGGARGAP
ncbi:MAG: DUF58 domain-containing protein [Caulobacteraceae bacterium]|nr:DUF58 domain-containing protein [Caulobacteraceae bacterium]MDX5393837.1 DUF58 domain-containing protein [Caulobacteraceae bacterium]